MKEFISKLYRGNMSELRDDLSEALRNDKKLFLITANPEIIMKAEEDTQLRDILLDENVMITPDGEGVVKAASMYHMPVKEKLAGVESVAALFQMCNDLKKKIYCYGSKQEVLDALTIRLKHEYPDLIISGLKNGYEYDEDVVFQDISKQEPDVILVALGVPRQEIVIYRYFKDFNKGIFVGVGGSLDVLSGTKKRAPKIFIKCKLEWLYRLLKEPKRIKRFYQTHIKFIFNIKRYVKEDK